jgi:hypothetical protein
MVLRMGGIAAAFGVCAGFWLMVARLAVDH